MRGSPISYNAVDGNYWRDRVDVVNGEKLVVLACRRGYQYWPLDGSAPQLLLDEPGAPHPERSAFGDQDESKWRDGPNLSDRSLCRYLGAVLRQSRHGRGVDVHHVDGGRLHGGRDPCRGDPQEAPALA
jgi:hypothetical protein